LGIIFLYVSYFLCCVLRLENLFEATIFVEKKGKSDGGSEEN
jgi:hypothetical protein